jgi:hypothetical protein
MRIGRLDLRTLAVPEYGAQEAHYRIPASSRCWVPGLMAWIMPHTLSERRINMQIGRLVILSNSSLLEPEVCSALAVHFLSH